MEDPKDGNNQFPDAELYVDLFEKVSFKSNILEAH